MKTAGPLQKLLHLANAREALRSGDLVQALSEVDAAVAADPAFAAAQTLRAEIVARMNATVVSECVTAVPDAAPVAVVAVVAEPLIPASIAVTTTTSSPGASSIAAPQKPHHRRSSLKLTAIPIVLGVLVIAIGVGVVLLGSGIVSRERAPVHPVAVVTAHLKPVLPSDIVLPAPPRAAAVTASVTPAAAVPLGETRTDAAIEWASPRLTHLSVRPRWRASALHVEDAALLKDLGQGVGELWVGKLTGNEDAIFIGSSIDEGDWAKLRASIKPTGVVWRIYSNRASSSSDVPIGAAIAAGFSRVKKVRYSADFSAEQFALRRGPR